MGNVRGSKFAMKHRSIDPQTREFWRFSFHEIGIYDISALIDYVLSVTQKTSLFFVAHNQGTTALMVLLSSKPDYNDKIIHAHLMAPIVFMDNPHPLVMFGAEDNLRASRLLGNFNFFSISNLANLIIDAYCADKSYESMAYCTNLWFFLFGRNINQTEIQSNVLLEIPNFISPTASLMQWNHFLQLGQSGKFQTFDNRGDDAERNSYSSPSEYTLSNVKVPMFLYHAAEDLVVSRAVSFSISKLLSATAKIISSQDVERFKSVFKSNVREYKIIDNWNHMDFLYSRNARKVLYNGILQAMNNEGLDIIGYVKNFFDKF